MKARKVLLPELELFIRLNKGVDENGQPIVEDKTVTTQELLVGVALGTDKALTWAEQIPRLDLVDAIRGAKNGYVLLQDEPWGLLKKWVEENRWDWVHRDIGKIVDAVTNAELVDVEETEGARPTRAVRRRAKRAAARKEH